MFAVQLDKERHFRLTLGGIAKFKEVTGKNLLKDMNIDDLEEREIIALIWCCLVWEDHALTLEDVSYMVDIHNLGEVTASLVNAIKAETRAEPNPNP
jgi:hypothetical protein